MCGEKYKKENLGFFGKSYDQLVTVNGQKQAIRAGNAIKADLRVNRINYIFCSKLRRTYQTAIQIIISLNKQHMALHLHTDNPIIVLPCSHELATTNLNRKLRTPDSGKEYDNGAICTNKTYRKTTYCTNPFRDIESVPGFIYYKLNWDFYDKTINKWYKSEKVTCTKNNNMISYIIKYINEHPVNENPIKEHHSTNHQQPNTANHKIDEHHNIDEHHKIIDILKYLPSNSPFIYSNCTKLEYKDCLIFKNGIRVTNPFFGSDYNNILDENRNIKLNKLEIQQPKWDNQRGYTFTEYVYYIKYEDNDVNSQIDYKLVLAPFGHCTP